MKQIKKLLRSCAALCLVLAGAGAAAAQKHEVAALGGGLVTADEAVPVPGSSDLQFGTGFTFQGYYARRLADLKLVGVYLEFPVVYTPRTETISGNALAPERYSSLFITPGIKLKFIPGFPVSPWLAVGGGYARFKSGDRLNNGMPNPGERAADRGALDFGGGIDLKIFPYLSLRGEVRDFYTGQPRLNVPLASDRRHNVVVAGGIVLRF